MSAVIEMVGSTAKLSADNNAEISRDYAITGTTSAENAVIALRDYLLVSIGNPPNIGALVLDNITDAEQIQNIYYATASWKTFARKEKPAEGDSQFSFELGLESVKVDAAIGGIKTFKAPNLSDWKPEKINDRGDGSEAEGVEIFEPVYEESETHWFKTSDLTLAYRDTISNIVGHTNNAPFKGYQAGEVLFKGVSGSRRGANDSEITFRWSVRRNQNDFQLGDVKGITKKGWEYLWPRYQVVRQFEAPSINKITHVAIATVFPEADFSGLNIGT